MKILHVINDLETGGAQRLVADMLPLMQAEGHTVDLLVIRDLESDMADYIRQCGITIHSLHARSLKSPRLIRQIRRFIPTYDIVHVHLFPALYLVALARRGTRPRLFYTEHSTSNRRRTKPYLRPIEKFIYSRYDRIISISPETCTSLIGWLGNASPDRHVVIENGVDLSRFEFCAQRRELQYRRLIMVARFVEAKNHAQVIRAMSLLPLEYHVTFVGDGPTLPACRQLAADLGVADRITFVGTRSDIPDLLVQADLGIHCSHWEGFGLTSVEIMASGLPVIVTDVPGLRQVVEGAGLIVPDDDAETLAQTIQNVLSDETFYAQIVEKCKKRAVKYNNHTMVSRYIQEYHNQY